ncbi:MAG TPA: hypothetical protein VNT03_16295 [Baekduia sp.]|nr:hypothetical protein [Baekduia sp.]
MTATRVLRHLLPLVAVCALAPAGVAHGASASALLPPSASSSMPSAAPAQATDGVRSTAWRAGRAGAWWLRAELRRAAAVDSLDLLVAGRGGKLTIATSADGRTFRRAVTISARAGAWRRVDLDGRRIAAVRVSAEGATAAPIRVAELRVRVTPAAETHGTVRQAVATSPAGDGSAAATGRSAEQTLAAGAGSTAGTAVPATGTASVGPAPAPAAVNGSFAGVVTNPIDPAFLTRLPFGTRSHWLQPWRAYLDTPPASRLRDAIGINFNVTTAQAPAVARLLAASGFRRGRIEIGWGELRYDDPTKLVSPDEWETKLAILRDYGIRPLILLNSNDRKPAPLKRVQLKLAAGADVGARTVQLDAASAAAVVPGYTGFDGSAAAALMITAVSPSGVATLAKPLPIAVPAGTYPASILKYKPFSPLRRDDGTVNPDGEQTLRGWLDYVAAVTAIAKRVLGSNAFDLEVWNEYTFGASFLDANNYADPRPYGSVLDDQVILRRTVDLVKDPARGLQGVRVGSGFSNQRPWDSGATAPVGLDALDKHPYPNNTRFPADTPNQALDALGQPAFTIDAAGKSHDTFSPTYDAFFPEYYLTGVQTESLVRDIAPITTAFAGPTGVRVPHGRATAPVGGTAPATWMTEAGIPFSYAVQQLGVSLDEADLERLKAKATLRTLTAFVNKGVSQVDLFSAGGAEWGLVGGDFWRTLQAGGAPGDTAGGPVMDAVRRLVGTLGVGRVTTPRALTLASIGDYAGRKQFEGRGTAAQPALYDRDVLAFLPFQAADDRFVAAVYVMTRDLVRVERPGVSGPTRFDLPAERYQLTIGGVRSAAAHVSATDPLTGASVPVDVVRRDPGGWLVVELPVTDSPRLLSIQD